MSTSSLQPTTSIAEGVEAHRRTAAAMLEGEDYAGAVSEGQRALDILPDLAKVAVVRGRALLCPLLDRLYEELDKKTGEPGTAAVPLSHNDFKDAYEAFPVSYTHLTLPTICSV